MTFFELSIVISLGMLFMALLLTMYRFVAGPSLEDRVVALDLVATIIIGLAAVYAIQTFEETFLDTGLILALIAFIGTVAYAYYLERRLKK